MLICIELRIVSLKRFRSFELNWSELNKHRAADFNRVIESFQKGPISISGKTQLAGKISSPNWENGEKEEKVGSMETMEQGSCLL